MVNKNTTPLTAAEMFFGGADKQQDVGPSHSPTQPHTEAPMPPPYDTPPNAHSQIMIMPEFINPEMCKALCNYADERNAPDLSVFDAEETNKTKDTKFTVDKSVRNTQMVEYDEDVGQQFNQVIAEAVRNIINPFYGINIQSAEAVQFLKYGEGGKYDVHIDAESLWHVKDENKLVWKKSMERDISILIYLNEDYEGGELVFPNQHISLQPKTGMLVTFPSDHHFAHGVMPVTHGTRYALVTWASLAGIGEQ